MAIDIIIITVNCSLYSKVQGIIRYIEPVTGGTRRRRVQMRITFMRAAVIPLSSGNDIWPSGYSLIPLICTGG